MPHPVHQVVFECHNCGEELGYIQSVGEPNFCPVCGTSFKDDGETDLIEFTIIEGDYKKPEPQVQLIERHPDEVHDPRPKKMRTAPARPTSGHRGVRPNPDHKIVNDPPVVTSVIDGTQRRQYTVDCGYTGDRACALSHLVTWHSMTLLEAKKAVLVDNHESVDLRGLPAWPCEKRGLRPVTCEIIGHISDVDGDKRYIFRVKECGFVGMRSSTNKHLRVHHGYTLKETRDIMNIRNGIVSVVDPDRVFTRQEVKWLRELVK